MPVETNVTKNVLSGSAEYTVAKETGAAGDFINMTFDNDLILDDIMVLGASSTVDFNVVVTIQYPSGAQMEVAPSTNVTSSAPYQLNDGADSRNMWFRIPKWSVLRFEIFSITTAGALQISVAGRG